jgi:RHS repeat-associated protein
MRSWRYVYDEEDQLLEAIRGDGLRIQYLYDPFGRRMAETIGGTTTWFGWDGNALVDEQTTTGGRVMRVFAEDGYTPLMEARDEKGFSLVATDATGTPFLYVGKDGETSDLELSTWGEVARANGEIGTLRFAGQRADAVTGLHYNRNRYYAPDLHVYLTPDPLGMEGSTQDIGFVPNTTYYIDPLGLLTIITASNDPNLINNYYVNYPTQYPGARVLTPSQVTPGSLAGETEVMIDTHGAPGSIEWDGGYINGTDLGDRLNAAGFNGSAPGARVDVIACNSATSPRGGPSVSQAVANRTGATTSGGQALFNSSYLGNKGWSGLVSGMPSGNPPSGLRVNGMGRWRSGIQPQPGNP